MDRLRPRQREVFPIFTKAEIEKMENLLEQSREPTLDEEFCKKLTLSFNRSQGRVGKPILKWNQVHSWFLNRQEDFPHKDSLADAPKRLPVIPETCPPCKAKESSEMSEVSREKVPDLSELEFEARSSKDAAWYDVDTFISHRFLASGEAEVRVRYVGFGADEDEWVNVKKAVRERSVPMEHSECHKVGVGDLVVCFQEKGDQARYYDAYVLEIQRKLHDIRGCRCLFLIRYDHDNTEERVRLRRLCCRPIEVLAH